MPMQTVQVRLTKEQLKLIDAKVKRGEYPSRSEAIRDYLRKAEFLELFSRFLEVTGQKPFTMKELEQTRAKVWHNKFAARVRARKAQ
jgi:Arc/MetJ-type ribon-helix-helix transcriptional regulator